MVEKCWGKRFGREGPEGEGEDEEGVVAVVKDEEGVVAAECCAIVVPHSKPDPS